MRPNYDPTGTTLIRRGFMREYRRRMTLLGRQVRQAVADNDMLGLGAREKQIKFHAAGANRYRFETDPQKVKSFTAWFMEQASKGLLGISGAEAEKVTGQEHWWTDNYITSAYKKGVKDAYQNGISRGFSNTIWGNMSTAEMADKFFYQPVHARNVQRLYTRSFELMKRLNKDMGLDLGKSLARSMADGVGAEETARRLQGRIQMFSRSRAMTIARTEVIHAHAEGTLDNYEEMGAEGVEVVAEWEATGDSRVCPLCEAKQGTIMTIAEARGMIPYHPNCRCAFLPIPFDDLSKKQQKALRASGKLDGGKAPAPKPKPTGGKKKPPVAPAPEPAPTETGNKGGTLLGTSPDKVAAKKIVLPTPVVPTTEIGPKFKTAEEYRLNVLKAATPTPEEQVKYVDVIASMQGNVDRLRAERMEHYKESLRNDIKLEYHQEHAALYKEKLEAGTKELKRLANLQKEYDEILRKRAWAVLEEARNLTSLARKDWGKYADAGRDVLSMMPADKYSTNEKALIGGVSLSLHSGKEAKGTLGDYSERNKQIRLFCDKSRSVDPRYVFAHEFAHHISYQCRDIMNKTVDFFHQRTKEEPLQRLPGFAAKAGINGKPDNFQTLSVYAGRVYRDGSVPEIISVGVEHIYLDPIRAATKDPEWFNTIMRAMKRLEA